MLELVQKPVSEQQSLTSQSLSRFLLFSMVVLAFFAILNFYLGFKSLALVEALVLLTLPFAYSWLKRGAPHGIIKHLIGFDTLVIFAPLIFIPTADNTGIYWIFGYPMIVFFFLGVRTGSQWIFIYLFALLVCLALAQQGILTLYHTGLQLTLAFVEIIVFSAIGYFFVSDRERAEQLHLSHRQYLENLEQIERALHTGFDMEKSMNAALQCMLEIFSCSRAWLLCPADPNTPTYRIPFEKTVPEFPGAMSAGMALKTDEPLRNIFISALKNPHPDCYGPQQPFDGESEITGEYSILSLMVIALNRDSREPWLLGLHQCDRERIWSTEEQRLFQDIAKRVEDALNQMLLYRELATSEQHLREAIKQAESASHAKSEFLSTISHELRTPLHGIIGLQELIAADADGLSSEQRENLMLAQQSAKSLRALVNDVLDLAKIESGNMELVQERFQLFNCIRDALVPFIHTARKKNITLSLIMEKVPATIIGDESRLRQVLLNLIGNATKFTDQGEISVQVTDGRQQLCFDIRDTGIGIPSANLETIFEPFTQAKEHQNLPQKGTGLGTSIAKRFVELMDGTIQVESTIGKGSHFTVRIPCNPAGRETVTLNINVTRDDLNIRTTEHEPAPISRPQPLRALMAEDDPIGQHIAIKQLSKAGIDVDVVDNGDMAWERVRQQPYDLLLTDIRMPGISGIELTRKIRQMEQENGLPRLPIIGLSAHALEEVAKECLDAGMDHFLTKPVDPESILSAVTSNAGH